MKTEITNTGWNEIITKSINVTFRAKPFQPISFWLEHQKRHPEMNNKGRNHCERCKVRWNQFSNDEMTYFVMTDKGNKVVCQACWDAIGVYSPKIVCQL
jgi:hypothetical protein